MNDTGSNYSSYEYISSILYVLQINMDKFKNAIVSIGITLIIIIPILIGIIALAMSKTHASSEWTKETYKKQEKLKSLGFSDTLSSQIINRCKNTAKNPEHCVITAGYIGKNESNAGNMAYKNNVFGINEGKNYKSKEENFERWLKSYNKWWYRTKHPRDFYPARGEKSKTNYCTSEESSKSLIGCPNGLKISTKAFNFLKS